MVSFDEATVEARQADAACCHQPRGKPIRVPVALALREGPNWRAGQQGCQTLAFVSIRLSPMPLFAANLETQSI